MHQSSIIHPSQRFSRDHPCPICGGHTQLRPGQGERCFGFVSTDGTYAHCSREEVAGDLPIEEEAQTYAHFLGGGCKCGHDHSSGEYVSFQTPPVRKESKNGHPESNPLRRKVGESRWTITHDDQGTPIQHVRYDFDDDTKQMWWQRGFKTSLNGLDPKSFPLYGTRHEGSIVAIVVEGEKCADALASVMERKQTDVLGTVLGAPRLPHDEVLEDLARYDLLYLWPDNDDKGRTLMQRLGDKLETLGRDPSTIRLIDPSPLAPTDGWDAADFVALGYTAEHIGSELCRTTAFVPTPPDPEPEPDKGPTRHILFTTASTVRDAVEEVTPWLVEPWLVEGAVTELSGKVKSAGKTTFVTHMVRALLDGKPFLMKPTKASPVVYLSEQGPRSLRATLERADLLGREDDMPLLLFHHVVDKPWESICQIARDEARRIGAKLIVVDTLGQFSRVSGDSENDAGVAQRVMAPLQEMAAADGVAILTLRHDRKGGGEVGDSARGSSAYAGAVDIVLRLRRGEGKTRETIRIIDGLSRFDETPDSFVVELTNRGYEPRGTLASVAFEEAKRAVWGALPTSEGDAQPRQDICTAAEVSASTGNRALEEYLRSGVAVRIGEGRRNDPYRYWRPDFQPS
jgi:hypothetical protein